MEKYNDAKGRNQEVSGISRSYVSDRMQKRIEECGNWLNFIADCDVTKQKLAAANFCKWRFCPMCTMLKAKKDAMKIAVCMTYIAEEHRQKFIFVTLTTPNVKADKLNEEIDNYNEAFKRLIKRDEIKVMNNGYIRKLEITYDGEPVITKEMYEKRRGYYERRGLIVGDPNPNYDTYHPHFHVVFAVNSGYFYGGNYVEQAIWLELWRKCMRDFSITQVDVRGVTCRNDSNEMAEGYKFDAAEFAKYAAKDKDFMHSRSVFDVFYCALKGRQVLTYGGLFAEANKKLKNDELEEYIKPDNTVYYWEIMYSWKGKEYIEEKRRELNATDKLFLARRGINTGVADR